IFCLPSHHEPFGIVLIEAMAQALPIVATDSEGPSEILHDGIDAILVPRGDAEVLAQALSDMIADSNRAVLLGANAYHNARQTFDMARVGTSLDRAMQRVAQAKSAQRAEVPA